MGYISPRAIADFVGRRLPDSEALKGLPDDTIDAGLRACRFHTAPLRHQRVCLYAMLRKRHMMLAADMGLGKSKMALDVVRAWRDLRRIRRALVLVPGSANVVTWLEEGGIHAPDLRVDGLLPNDGPDLRARKLRGPADVLVVTYAGLLAAVCDKPPSGAAKGHGYARNRTAERALVDSLGFGALIADESTLVRNHKGLHHRVCYSLARRMFAVYALTGTPFGRDPSELWAQMRVVDDGEALGASLGLLRAAFYDEGEDPVTGFPRYTLRKREAANIRRLWRSAAIRYRDVECADLPPLLRSRRHVLLPPPAYKAYTAALDGIARGDADVAGGWHDARRAASGYRVDNSTPAGYRPYPGVGKPEALLELLDETADKALVFFDYTLTGRLLADKLKAAGIPYRVIEGEQSASSAAAIDALRSGAARVLLIQNQAGGYGLNLQAANLVVYYESPTSPVIRRQTEKRAHRLGQTRRVRLVDLVARGTFESRLLDALDADLNLFSRVINGEERLA